MYVVHTLSDPAGDNPWFLSEPTVMYLFIVYLLFDGKHAFAVMFCAQNNGNVHPKLAQKATRLSYPNGRK